MSKIVPNPLGLVLEPEDMAEMVRIGHQRKPREACGILLQTPHHKSRVIELPNRLQELGEFELRGVDIRIALEGYTGDWDSMAIWHTHPEGQLGPSEGDLENKPNILSHLIITLYDTPDKAKATWY